MRRIAALLATALIPLIAAPFAADAASLRLYGLAPFDVATGEVDLDRLEQLNRDPLWSRPYLVDEAGIEDQLSAIVDDLEPDPIRRPFVVDLGLFDVDLGGVEIRFDFGFGFRAGQGPEPDVLPIDPAGLAEDEAAFDVVVDAVADLTFRVDIDLWGAAEWLLGDSDPITLRVPVGAYADSRVTVWPQVTARRPVVAFDRAGPTHLSAPDWVRDVFGRMIDDAVTVFVDYADAQYADTLAAEIDALMQPYVEEADRRRDDLLNRPLPEVGMSLQQLMYTGLIDLDVRTRAQHGDGAVAATARFDVSAGAAFVEGTVHLPRSTCARPPFGGPGWSIAHNDDLTRGMPCSAAIDARDIVVRGWAGNDPAEFVGGASLPTWVDVGRVELVGTLRDAGSTWACDYRIDRLPSVGIYEIAVRHGSALADRMAERSFRARFLGRRVLDMVLYDSDLQTIAHDAVDFGGDGPDEGVCGDRANDLVERADRIVEFMRDIDPEFCPTCGPVMVFSERLDSRILVLRDFQPAPIVRWQVQAKAPFISHRPASSREAMTERFRGEYRVDDRTLDAMGRRAAERGLDREFGDLVYGRR